jgi:hypothetical protein
MKYLLMTLCFLAATNGRAQESAVGVFQDHIDVGNPKNAGATQYDTKTQTYNLKGSRIQHLV